MSADRSLRAWRGQVAAVVALGLAIRLAAVLARPHLVAGGDAAEYLGQANLLAEGKGFIEPLIYAATHQAVQTAKLPPLYIMVLSLCSLAGFKGFLAHRVWSAIIGASAVGLAAVVGKELAGPRVGLLAALLVAVDPNLWINDSLGMSETLTPVLVLLVLWAAYRMRRRPGLASAAWLGAAIGLAALGRDELILLALFILVPLVLGAPSRPWPERLRILAAGALACAVVVGPWIGYNMTRFTDRVFITDRFGATLAVANCDPAWRGPLAGYWSFNCALAAERGATGDESVRDAAAGRVATRYIANHLGGLPKVELERLGRTFGVYEPIQQIRLDVYVESHPEFWAFVGLGLYYALVPPSVVGVVLLRRRGVIVYPLLAVGADVVVAVLVTYGQTRFRAPLEPVLALLAAVAVDGLLTKWGSRRAPPAAEHRWRARAASLTPSDPT
jgi:4-amino-4-deoxy-L-arabinose transferase-like glycosyltransferase